MRISYINGSHVQFTLRELLGFYRDRHSATLTLALLLALIFLKPFPALGALPLASQVVFWGLVVPGTLAVHLAVLVALARRFRVGRSWIAHLVSATVCAVLSPELGTWVGLVHLGPRLPLMLFVGTFSLVCSMLSEFLMATYLLPRYLARLPGPPPPAPTPAPQQISLLGRPFVLTDLRLISAEEHYVHVQTVQGRQMLRGRISDIEAQLPDALGLRVHRSHWVAASAVKDLNRSREGWMLELADGTQVPVARARREAVRDWLEAMGKG